MNYANNHNAMNKYAQVGNQSTAAFANPHRLIQMLMEGALEKISKAKGFIKNNNIAKKGEHIAWAISIIEGLRVSLDHTQGGDVSKNLESLYVYMNSRLTQANLNNSIEILDEVTDLLLDQLPELEQLRDISIRNFFEEQDISAQNSNEVERVIKSVLKINDQITVLAEQRKVAISEQLQGLKKRKNVNSAYLQNK